jgi:hypothetical protein
MKWAGHVARMGEEEFREVFLGKPEVKRLLEIQRRRWVDNIEMELGYDGVV